MKFIPHLRRLQGNSLIAKGKPEAGNDGQRWLENKRNLVHKVTKKSKSRRENRKQ
jgi:hypothetical protein